MSEMIRLAIELSLIDAGWRNAISTITASLGKVRQHTDAINEGLLNWRRNLALVGGVLGFGGYLGLSGLKAVADQSKDLLDIQNQLERAGVSHNKVLETTSKFYSEIQDKIPTAKASEYLKVLGELKSITGDKDAPGDVDKAFQNAQGIAVKAMQIEALMANLKQGKGHAGGAGEYYQMLRSAEMKGVATDDAKREQLLDKMFAYISAFQGKLSIHDYLMMARQGGTAWIHADVEKALGPMSVLAAELGGSRAGTALKGLEMAQVGTVQVTMQQAKLMQEADLLKAEDFAKIEWGPFKRGHLPLGSLQGSTSYIGNLPGWMEEVVGPKVAALAHKKKEAGVEGTEEQIFEHLMGRIFKNRDQQRLAEMYTNPGFLDQIKKDMGLAGAVKGVQEQYDSYINQNPKGVEQSYEAARTSMMQAIGAPVMQAAIPVMQAITTMFQEIGRLANEHPKIIEGIAIGLGALSAALLATGIAAVIAAIGPVGWIAAGITALVAAVKGFQAGAFDGIVKAVKGLAELDIKAIGDRVVHFGTDLANAIQSALTSVVNQVNAWIKKQFTFTAPSAPPPAGSNTPAPVQPQSFHPGGQAGSGWEPGHKSPKVVQIAHTATLDGDVLARSIAQYLVAEMEHPKQAPYFDGRDAMTTVDHQPITT